MVAENLGKFVWEVEESMSYDELVEWSEYYAWVAAERKKAAAKNK